MKMAKASKADLDMAMELCSTLDALTGRWGAMMPEAIAQPEGTSDTEYFDPDDSEQCKRVVAYLSDLVGGASLMRVVWGMLVLLDPANKMVDPDADTLAHHPDTVRATTDAERYRWLRDHACGKNGAIALLPPGDMDAAIDLAMAEKPQASPPEQEMTLG